MGKMDVIIKTGFESVKTQNKLSAPSILKRNKLVLAKHARNFGELRTNGISYLIRTNIIRQTSVTRRGASAIITFFVVVSKTSVDVISAAFVVLRFII